MLLFDEEARGPGLRVQRIRRDDGARERQGREEAGEAGDLVGLGRHGRRRHHHGVRVEDRAQEVRGRLGPAVAAAERLPVHAERGPRAARDLEQPRADAGVQGVGIHGLEHPADRGLRRRRPPRRPQPAERLGTQALRPLRDGGEAARAGHRGADGEGHDHPHGVADPPPVAGIGHGLQAVQQAAGALQRHPVGIEHGRVLPWANAGWGERGRQGGDGPGAERAHPHGLRLPVGHVAGVLLREAAGHPEALPPGGAVAGPPEPGRIDEGLGEEHRVAVGPLPVGAQAAQVQREHAGREVGVGGGQTAEADVIDHEPEPAPLEGRNPAEPGVPRPALQRRGRPREEGDPRLPSGGHVPEGFAHHPGAREVVVRGERLLPPAALLGADEAYGEGPGERGRRGRGRRHGGSVAKPAPERQHKTRAPCQSPLRRL